MTLRQQELVAIDLETSGKYPLESDIIEIAAVRWRDDKIINTFQTFAKPRSPLAAENIAIHGITNEMLADASRIENVLPGFLEFIGDSILIAHHAPFDLGFLSVALEECGLSFGNNQTFCSSLMARKIIPESANHKLQTLIGYLGLERGAAHRALDDAKACLGVLLYCLKRLQAESLEQAFAQQGGPLLWDRFRLSKMPRQDLLAEIIRAIKQGYATDLVYSGGSKPGIPREVQPIGVVRSLDGDFVVALDPSKGRTQRYFYDQITGVQARL